MPFSFDKKRRKTTAIIYNMYITDKGDLEEIKKVSHILNPNEGVFVVARQSKLKPSGSKLTPNVVFATVDEL